MLNIIFMVVLPFVFEESRHSVVWRRLTVLSKLIPQVDSIVWFFPFYSFVCGAVCLSLTGKEIMRSPTLTVDLSVFPFGSTYFIS